MEGPDGGGQLVHHLVGRTRRGGERSKRRDERLVGRPGDVWDLQGRNAIHFRRKNRVSELLRSGGAVRGAARRGFRSPEELLDLALARAQREPSPNPASGASASRSLDGAENCGDRDSLVEPLHEQLPVG